MKQTERSNTKFSDGQLSQKESTIVWRAQVDPRPLSPRPIASFQSIRQCSRLEIELERLRETADGKEPSSSVLKLER